MKHIDLKSAACAVLASWGAVASAAQWAGTKGSDLDVKENWSGTLGTYAVRKAQSGPLTISSDTASLPTVGSTLQFDGTTDGLFELAFGAGRTFDLQGMNFAVCNGECVKLSSGTIQSLKTPSNNEPLLYIRAADSKNEKPYTKSPSLIVDGADACVKFHKFELQPPLESATVELHPMAVFDHGAKGAFTMAYSTGGGIWQVLNGASVSADIVHVLRGSDFLVSNATFNVVKEFMVDETASVVFDHATFSCKGQTNEFKFQGLGTICFKDSTVDFGDERRVGMHATDLTLRFENSTVTHGANALFITGTGVIADDVGAKRTLTFAGANPHFTISGSNGLHLRGGEVNLRFELPAEGFSTDHPVIELTHASASFRTDAVSETAKRNLVVTVDPKCPGGVYTLLKGKNATTFIPESNWTCDSARASFVKTTIDGVEALQLKVKSRGMMIILS